MTDEIDVLLARAEMRAGYEDNGGCADLALFDMGAFLRELAATIRSLRDKLAAAAVAYANSSAELERLISDISSRMRITSDQAGEIVSLDARIHATLTSRRGDQP